MQQGNIIKGFETITFVRYKQNYLLFDLIIDVVMLLLMLY